MEGPEIRAIHDVSETHEISVDWGGHNFLVIFGRHVNGWFIAVPNWKVCAEAGSPANAAYNAEKLVDTEAFANPLAPNAIAAAIAGYWKCI